MLRVGRIPFELEAVDRLQVQGTGVSLSAKVVESSGMAGWVAAEALAAYHESPDEPFVPVVWDAQPHVTGFYHPRSVSLTGARGMAPQGVWDVELELERVQGFSAPRFESRLLGATREGYSGTTYHWHALPDAATGYEQGSITPTMYGRPCEPPAGFVESRGLTIFRDYALRNSTVDFYVPPSDWYLGAPSLEVDGRLVVGRQVRQSQRWTLSNGVLRLHSNPGMSTVTMERWDGVRWVLVGDWTAGRYEGIAGGWLPLAAPHALTVLHNSAQLVSIRLSVDAASMYPGSRFVVDLDLSLRRGSAFAEVTLSTRGAYWWSYMAPMDYDSMTAVDDYLYVGGSQRTIATRTPTAAIKGVGGMVLVSEIASVQRQHWMWGAMPNSETPATIAAQYRSALTEDVRVVAR